MGCRGAGDFVWKLGLVDLDDRAGLWSVYGIGTAGYGQAEDGADAGRRYGGASSTARQQEVETSCVEPLMAGESRIMAAEN
jgi:hypothetical protein